MKYTCINIQGNLISEEILQKVEKAEAQGQIATDFWLEPGSNLRGEIEYAWSRVKLDWKHFSDRNQTLASSDPYGTTLSRKWMKNFLSSLGFELQDEKTSLKGDNNQEYRISHTAENLGGLPIHIVGFNDPTHPEKNTLDIKSSGGTSKYSPHGTMQEYLNVTENIYGIATNGLFLRLIRDSGRLIKLTYVEFDIKRMMDEDKYSEFVLLYRLLHASRFPRTIAEADQCLLEKYYLDSIETGNRIRDGLSMAVKESLLALGNGFLQHENNTALREKVQSGALSPKDYYRQLLRIIYRFLFLMVTEERDLVYDPEDDRIETLKHKLIYWQYYSIGRLRSLSENRYLFEAQFTDLWLGLTNTFLLFEAAGNGKKLGIQPLDGDLFSYNAIADLQNSLINNKLLLECVRNLNEFTDENKNLVPINYRSLDVEELGSVYEGLLELHPVIENIEAANQANIVFTFHEGTERKTTGSYYTRPELVNELIKSALIPVIEERLKENSGNKDTQAKALLKLKVCDAAAGSGHMLLAAGRTIAWYLARVQSGEENPAPSVYRKCLREVIQHCVYGVDMNPDAVELCKLALWLEGHNSGKPLSFLDHKIRNGNSLVGVTDLKVLEEPIPDEAFASVTGDDKEVNKELKKRNAHYRKTKQIDLFSAQGQQIKRDKETLNTTYAEMESIEQDTVEAVMEVKKRFGKVRSSVHHEEKACHIWTAAFFKTYTDLEDPTNPSSERLAQYFLAPTQYGRLVGDATNLATKHKFFHWPLEFPDVFEQGGFDVMLGNPPWEKIQPEEKSFFTGKEYSISSAKGKNRKVQIENLLDSNPKLFGEWEEYKSDIEHTSKFIKISGSFDLTAKGNLNTYSLFVNLVLSRIRNNGKGGLIVPSGFSTDDTTKTLFQFCIKENILESIFDFENKRLFFDAERNLRFSLLTFNKGKKDENVKLSFGLTATEQLHNSNLIYSLSKNDFLLLNPNTNTCPVFNNQKDLDIVKRIYSTSQILIREDEKESVLTNPWDIDLYCEGFNMTRAHHLFKNEEDLIKKNLGLDSRNYFKAGEILYFPVIESKNINLLNHRYATFAGVPKEVRFNTKAQPIHSSYEDLSTADYNVRTRYWVEEKEVIKAFGERTNHRWLLGFRNVCRGLTDYRTGIFSVMPFVAAGNSLTLIFPRKGNFAAPSLLIGNLTSIVFDYVLRQKLGGSNLNFFVIKQLPIIIKEKYSEGNKSKITAKVLELLFTGWDIKPFADDVWKDADSELQDAIASQWQENKTVTGGHEWNPPTWSDDHGTEPDSIEGCPFPPFKWDENRRAVLKAELDAIYAKLYGLTTEELRYILDPQDVYGPDFPGETFRVLKEKETRLYGEYSGDSAQSDHSFPLQIDHLIPREADHRFPQQTDH